MKKVVLVSVMACSVMLLVGCGKKAPAITTDDTAAQVTNTVKTDATKDQCMQMVVYGMKVAIAQASGDTATATQIANEAMAMEEQMKASNVEYENACEKYMTDASFIQEVQNQVKELQK